MITEDYYDAWARAQSGSNPHQYKSFIFFENIAKKHNLPPGIKVQLGVGWGFTLQKMKEHYGADQVLGIDIHNLNKDPSVFVVDIKNLVLKFPCAYIENDIGSSFYQDGKQDRWYATQWAVDCLVSGGIFITSADHVIDKPVSQFARDHGCDVMSMTQFDNEDWAKFLNVETPWKTQGYVIITKQ